VGVCTKRSITIFDFIVLLQLDLQLLQSGGNDKKKLARPLHTPRSGARKPLWHYSS